MKLSRWLFICLIFSFLALEAMLYWPVAFYVALAVLIVSVLILSWKIFKLYGAGRIQKRFLALPIIFVLGSILYSSLIPVDSFLNKILLQIIFAGVLIFIIAYVNNLIYYLRSPEKKNSIANFFSIASVAGIFLAVGGLFGWQLFWGLSFWPALLISSVLGATLLSVWLTAEKVSGINRRLFGINFLIFLEIAGALYALPFNYSVLALLFALSFYLIANLEKLFLANDWRRAKLRPLLLSVAIIFGLLLIAVRWR